MPSLKIFLQLSLLCPIIGSFVIMFTKSNQKRFIKLVGLICSITMFTCFLILWSFFNSSLAKFQFITKTPIVTTFNLNFVLGLDGISLFFLLLTTMLVPICLLNSWRSVNLFLKQFLIIFMLIDFLLINVFCCLDLILFYVFFEAILIPMFLLIGFWGSRERKVLANYYFFLYTVLGSIVMLLALVYIQDQVGITDYNVLLTFNFLAIEQQILWFCFFLSFFTKVPMVPVHLWLPEAHVEATTTGSVVLAGVLLKLGTYGFVRFSLPLFPMGSIYFTPLVYSLAIVGVIFGSFTAIRQLDLKKIIAYTSIAHMNLVLLGIFSFNGAGLEGALFQSLNHGFVSAALFLLIGLVYDRFKTRIVNYYAGLGLVMPLFVTFFLFFSLANIGFPCTGNFLGEFLIFTGSFKVNLILTVLSAISLIIGAVYSLWLFNRIAFGNLKFQYITGFFDINNREFNCLVPLVFSSVFCGLYSNILLVPMQQSVNFLIELVFI